MKNIITDLKKYYLHIHKISFALIAIGIIICCFCYIAALIVLNFPNILISPCDAKSISLELFKCGVGLFFVNIFFGFISDVVIKYDLE